MTDNPTREALTAVQHYLDRKHMNNRFDPTFVRAQIEALRYSHPSVFEDDETLMLALESETNLNEFLAQVVDRMDMADAIAEGIAHRIDKFKSRQARYVQQSDAMRALAFKLMDQAGTRKVELPAATLSIRAGVPRVIVTDEAALPPSCVRVRIEPNKVAIKEQIARGELVPGAEMSNAEPVLSVRIK